MIADLPGNYLNWMARTGFPKGELGRLLPLLLMLKLLIRWIIYLPTCGNAPATPT